MTIRPFRAEDGIELVRLWERCGLVVPWNDPVRDIERKLAEQPELLLVAEKAGDTAAPGGSPGIAGSVMAGYDGHRGWINYLAVHPDLRGSGLGGALMAEAERLLRERGCPKINLQVRASNARLVAFYEHMGFVAEDIINMGKRLVDDTDVRRGTP
jgi:ribosomal protein S18 acetylase RimI-like enzyme